MARKSALVGLVAVGVIAAIQLVPQGPHLNPPVVGEPPWDRPATRALAVRACFDCHSNETVWPWYASVAPASWLVRQDVVHGRREVNFSEWALRRDEAHESAEATRSGSMPPWHYSLAVARARLTEAERARLVAGLEATFRPTRTSPGRAGDSGVATD
jgi:hypothetical protein